MNKSIQFEGKNIAYTKKGSGKAIVLLHGFLESKEIWEGFVEILQKDFTVLAIDLPGHGKSEVVAENHTMQLMAQVVKTILDKENIFQAIVVGHSMGGYVALEFAASFPKSVQGLVLFHSHAKADSDETKEIRRRTIAVVQQNKGSFIKHFIPDLFDQKHLEKYSLEIKLLQDMADCMLPEAIIAAISGMRERHSQLQFLLVTKTPLLFIIGKQDSRMPYSQIIEQAVIPSQSEILLLDNVGHMGFIEAPGITLNAIKHFAIRCYESVV